MSALLGVHTDEDRFEGPGGKLFRRSLVPEGETWARVALVHGYGEHSGRHDTILRWLAERGVAAHAFDLRGQGRSEGRRGAVVRWDEYLDDVAAFLGEPALREAGSDRPLFLIGHSHGGLVLILAVLRRMAEASGVILSAPYLGNRVPIPAWKSRAARVLSPVAPGLRLDNGLKQEWMSRDTTMIAETQHDPLVCKTATPRWFLGCHDAQQEALRRASEFRLPLLVLQGEADPVSDPATTFRFAASVRSQDCTVRKYPEMLHELFRERSREEVYEDVLEWMTERAGVAAGPTEVVPG